MRKEHSFEASNGAQALPFGHALDVPHAPLHWRDRWHERTAHIDFAPDLGADIGSLDWWRGLLTCTALVGMACLLRPSIVPFGVSAGAPLSGQALEAEREQAVAPLAWGADSGSRMGATHAVVRLATVPERPQIDVTATLGTGDGFGHVLTRAGVDEADASRIKSLIAQIVPLADIKTGTMLNMTLGEHASKNAPRPLEHLAMRARLDLKLDIARDGNGFKVTRIPIAVDYTPLKIEGQVGSSMYRAARAAGAPMDAVEAALHVLGSKDLLDDLDPDARFSLVIEQARAATGEVEHGKLLYIGLEHGDETVRMIEWPIDGHDDWYDLASVAEKRSGFTMPVANAHITSGFGMRFHPILGFTRMHQGIDYGAPYGSPIHAISDGVVTFTGWHGGHGNFVQLRHAYGLGSGYAHMSRIAVRVGEHVGQGEVIGYVGSTGLSTGPHLHFEAYRYGKVVNPASVKFSSVSLLDGKQLAAFKAKIASFVNLHSTN